ncbi:MAG: hypothetical protein WCS80_00090 [Bacilli bacterium]
MLDFKNKVIKVNLNTESGLMIITGPYIKSEENFLVVYNPLTEKIEYLSMYIIKSVSIVRDIEPDDLKAGRRI